MIEALTPCVGVANFACRGADAGLSAMVGRLDEVH